MKQFKGSFIVNIIPTT